MKTAPKAILFSKTLLSDVPRLRHQFISLLDCLGYEVTFVEKPIFILNIVQIFKNLFLADHLDYRSIRVRRVRFLELLHHQIRIGSFLINIEQTWQKLQLLCRGKSFSSTDIIFNFNYDYFWLSDLFPGKKIISIVNDDFVAQAKFFQGKNVELCYRKLELQSDVILVVSPRLQKYFERAQLFLPWASGANKPQSHLTVDCSSPPRILVWASIGSFIDFSLIGECAECLKDFEIDLVGPLDHRFNAQLVGCLKQASNVNYLGIKTLGELVNRNYFCSLIPYKLGVPEIEAIYVSNKTFQILEFGLPLVTHGMPYFLNAPVIFRCETYTCVISRVTELRESYASLTANCVAIARANSVESRATTLREILGEN